MSLAVPRIRMFAGPNGSGKSTIAATISPELLGILINPDEIEAEIRKVNTLDFGHYEVQTTAKEVLDFFTHSSLLEKVNLIGEAQMLRFVSGKLIFRNAQVNAYFASVAADFNRKKLLECGKSFSFETVMSFPDKIELLRNAQEKGYRTYLYYIATEDPEINISRVRHRVKMGGHAVPEDLIVSRYKRSLDLLMEAIQYSHHSYIFDNSSHKNILIAEIINGRILEMKTNLMPGWFKKALWDKFNIATHLTQKHSNSR